MVITFIILVMILTYPVPSVLPSSPCPSMKSSPSSSKKEKTLSICCIIRPPMKIVNEMISFRNVLYFEANFSHNHDDSIEECFVS